jgi:hypothetical protein
MKSLKIMIGLAFIGVSLVSVTSCLVIETTNGTPKGWNKNPNNPHHVSSTNPGHGRKGHK